MDVAIFHLTNMELINYVLSSNDATRLETELANRLLRRESEAARIDSTLANSTLDCNYL